MLKYCFITDQEKGLVQLGAGCSDEYYQEIGMEKRDVEQSDKDNQWYLSEKCPHKTDEEKLQDAKDAKKQENDTKRQAIKAIKVYFSADQTGYLLRQTPVGDISTIVLGLALPAMMAQQPIPAETMRYYDGEGIPHPTPEIAASFVPTFYQRFAGSIAGIDGYSTDIEKQISEATTIEEVNAIVIDYTVIGAM